MSTIDDRIVAMKFQNTQFQQGAAQTLSILDKLKSALRLDGAKKGFEDVDAAANAVKLSGMAQGIDAIKNKFSAMSIIAITALTNITNKAINAGTQLAKSFTVQPILDGFAEYELKMGSIQTILANTSKHGTTLDQVTAALDKLNEYADKTIYNFGDMTRNIGLFTNAGIGIEDATAMIKGFSNEAASSGTSAQGAAGAAYQLSQALSSGMIRLMDWKSLTNVGMGSKNMQEGIIQIAEAMGTFEGKTITSQDALANFNASLEKEWLTADVMQNYLKIQAGDLSDEQMRSIGLTEEQMVAFKKQSQVAQDAATKVRTFTQLLSTLRESVGSGWAQTFDILIGDFNDATDLWTSVNDKLGGVIGSMSDQRNKILQDWADLGGRAVLIEGLGNAFQALFNILGPIKDAFVDIFPPATGQSLYDLTVRFRDFTKGLVAGSETVDRIKRVFTGIFSVLHLGWTVVKNILGVFTSLFGIVSGGSGGFLELAARVGDYVTKISQAIEKSEGLQAFFEGLRSILAAPLKMLRDFGDTMLDAFKAVDGDAIFGAFEKLGSKLTFVGDIGRGIRRIFEGLIESFTGANVSFGPLADKINGFFSGLGDILKQAFSGMDFDSVLALINSGLLAGIVVLFKKFVGSFGDGVDSISEWGDKLTSPFEAMTDTLGAMQNTLRATTLLQIAAAIGILAASAVALSKIDAAGLTRALTAMAVMMGQLMIAMAVFQKIDIASGMTQLILLAIAIRILTSAVTALADLDWEELGKGLLGTAVLLGAVVAAAKLMPDGKEMISSSIGIILISAAIKVLASAVEDLSKMSWEEMAQGLVGVGVLLGALGVFAKFTSVDKSMISSGIGILLIAAAMKVLASAAEDFSSMNWEEIGKGLASIGGILAAVATFTKMTGNPAQVIASSAALIIVGAAMKIVASAMQDFANMSWEGIGKGMTGVAGALTAIGIAIGVLPPSTIVSAAAILVVAASLGMISDAMQDFGDMSWEEIAKGMTMLTGALLVIAGGLALMSGSLTGAAALIVIAAALKILAPVLISFGEMSWVEIGKGLLMLAGTFTVLGLAALILQPVVPIIMALGAAILLLGVGVMAAGAGVLFLAVGLGLLTAAGTATAAMLVEIGTALIELIPSLLAAIAEGLVAFAQVIIDSGPTITAAIVTILLSMITAARTVLPELIALISEVITEILDMLEASVPGWVDSGLKIIQGIYKGVSDNMEQIVTGATNVIVAFINGIAKNLPRIIQAGVSLIIAFVNGVAQAIRNNSAAMGEAGANLATAIVQGMVRGIGAGIGSVISAATNMAQSALNAAKNALGIKSPSREFAKLGANIPEGVVVGIDRLGNTVSKATENLGREAIEGMRKTISGLDRLVTDDVNFEPLISPVLDLSKVEESASKLDSILKTKPLKLTATYSNAAQASDIYQKLADQRSLVEQAPTSESLVFNQYNSSPKALSEADIYRQTKNQISVAKGALTG